MDFRATEIDFRYKSNMTWKTASFSSQCIRTGDKPGSVAGYNYNLSQNEVLVVGRGHTRVAAIKHSTKGCTSTSQSHMPSNSCVYAPPIITIQRKSQLIFWGSWI